MATTSPHDHHDWNGGAVLERNRYFTGKLMAARDFNQERDYFLDRHRLHNRLLHGWGVVAGLDVRPHHDPDCRDRYVVVEPGVALDCHGRELVLEKPKAVALHPRDADAAKPSKPPPLLLCLQYEEQHTEQMPVLWHEGACDPARSEANRVREVTRVDVVPADQFGDDCWPVNVKDAPCVERPCAEPACPCGERVPIARITPNPAGGRQPYRIDTEHRRRVPMLGGALTHIIDHSWPHGGVLLRRDLQRAGRELRVRFDRPLEQPRIAPGGKVGPHGLGINEYTFVVEFTGAQRDVEYLEYEDDKPPRLTGDGCTAVFTLSPKYFKNDHNTIAGHAVLVTLRCDFLVDRCGLAVDGTYVGARRPTGNGIPGGDFTSWFEVKER